MDRVAIGLLIVAGLAMLANVVFIWVAIWG